MGTDVVTEDSYTTVVKRLAARHSDLLQECQTDMYRWPTILTQIVNTVNNEVHVLSMASQTDAERNRDKIAEGKQIISQLSELKHDMGRNLELT